MLFYEASAVEGQNVEDAFIEMAKKALKRSADQPIMPPSMGGAGSGSLIIKKKDHNDRGQTQMRSNCC